jgi:hypothetical protein
VRMRTNYFSASFRFLVGGIRNEIRRLMDGSMTLPAVDESGNPEAPITASCGFHPLAIMLVKMFWCALLTFS